MRFGIRCYWKPTPKKLRVFGDTLLAISLFASPYQIVHEDHRLGIIVLIVGIIGKFLTNYFAVEDKKK